MTPGRCRTGECTDSPACFSVSRTAFFWVFKKERGEEKWKNRAFFQRYRESLLWRATSKGSVGLSLDFHRQLDKYRQITHLERHRMAPARWQNVHWGVRSKSFLIFRHGLGAVPLSTYKPIVTLLLVLFDQSLIPEGDVSLLSLAAKCSTFTSAPCAILVCLLLWASDSLKSWYFTRAGVVMQDVAVHTWSSSVIV